VELVDIGVNLTSGQFAQDRPAVLLRAVEAGVKTVIVTGTSVEGSREAAALVATRVVATPSGPALFATAGVHPHHAAETVVAPGEGATGDRWLAELEELHRQPGIVAVGECGLDFDRKFSPPADQRRCFEAQLELAAGLGRPVFLHERAAHADLMLILERHRPRLSGAVVHCFTGSEAELAAYLDLGLHIGLTGWICDERRGSHMRAFLSKIPADRLMVETDAPYLLPRTMPRDAAGPGGKSRRNEPAFLPWVVAALAEARGETPAEVARQTTATARAFFALP
jgi:TatD DNase family protein